MAAKKNKPLDTEEMEDIEDVLEEEASPKAKKEKKVKEKKEKPKKEKTKKKSAAGSAKAFVIIFVLALLGAAVWIVGWNGFGLRDKYLAPILQEIPIVKNLVPPPETEDEENAVSTDELNAQIADLQNKLNAAQKQIADSQTKIEQQQQQIATLKTYESQQIQFKEDKAAFDEAVALGDSNAYSQYYEQIYPENAANLYPQAKAESERQQEINNYLSMIDEQDESATAKTLEELVVTDLDLVVEILKNLSPKKAAAVMDEISAQNAASIYKRWSPLST